MKMDWSRATEGNLNEIVTWAVTPGSVELEAPLSYARVFVVEGIILFKLLVSTLVGVTGPVR